MGMFVGPGNKLGDPLKIESADEHVFGFHMNGGAQEIFKSLSTYH